MKSQFLGLLIGALTSLIGTTSLAALGDQVVTSSAANSSSSRSSLSTSTGAAFSVSETKDVNGIIVRQYVDSAGLVFGISWQGDTLPSLDSLFGTYLTEYQNALKTRPKSFGRRALKVSTKNIVVEGFSRQRSQGGRAYIPANLPQGFNIEEIKFND